MFPMSQKKVEQYKEYKKNKAKILKKEKTMRRIELGAVILVCAAFIGWFGWLIYRTATTGSTDATTSTVSAAPIDLNAYIDYTQGLQSTYSS